MAVELDGHTLVTWWLARKQRGWAGPREGITFKSPLLVIYFLKAKQPPKEGPHINLGINVQSMSLWRTFTVKL